jgi:hypothetical protein
MAAADAANEARLAAAAADAQTVEDAYYTKKVGTTGKTQAQLDAAAEAAKVAQLTNQTVNPKTGYVEPAAVKKTITPVVPVVPVTPVAPVTPAGKKVVGTNIITVNGKQVMVTTFDDGTTTQTDYGSATNPENAIANLTSIFSAYGLGGDFANAIKDMVVKGYTADTITLIAQDPNSTNPLAVAFQQRFAGNAARVKAGMAPLSPAEYIATERSYRQIMSAAGLPKGFYDSNSDFTSFISKDVSPTELKSRVDLAASAVANADPFYTSSLQSMYGLSTGDMIAHALDPQAALPLLQKQAEAVKIGTAAARQGWGISAAGAENLYTQGVSAAQAEQGFRTVAGMQTEQQRLAQIWGGDTAAQGQNLVASTFGTAGAAYADQQIKALQQKEIGSFSGGSGAAKGSLGIGVEQTGGGL